MKRQGTPLWRNVGFVGFCLVGAGALGVGVFGGGGPVVPESVEVVAVGGGSDFDATLAALDAAVADEWKAGEVDPVGDADTLLVLRRLSLALTGTVPSLEELKQLDGVAEADRVDWWLGKLFADRRSSDYLAERFARVLVGVEGGPSLVYRRRRMVNWLSDQLWEERRYDELVRNLIAAEGTWTSEPEVNFLTVTIDQNEEGSGPDEVKLAARVSRAFLGVRIDCVECHDDFFGDRWKQSDFHQLAAYFGDAKMALSGVRDDDGLVYQTRYRGELEEVKVAPGVPFSPELMPDEGTLRQRLAAWVTHEENGAFARATVNRVWALMFNKPRVEPIDDIPLEGPWPGAIEILADDFVENGFDLRRLVRLIARSRVFGLASRAADGQEPPGEAHADAWAAFPLTRLRPEQMAGGLLQASSLRTIDADSHVLKRLIRLLQQGDFIKRYGDSGEDEFADEGGTIPQRLLMMNGELLRERTGNNVVMNASTRIGALAPDGATAVDSAYQAVLTRLPSEEERDHFVALLEGTDGDERADVMADLFWVLMNSTEFSWNH